MLILYFENVTCCRHRKLVGSGRVSILLAIGGSGDKNGLL